MSIEEWKAFSGFLGTKKDTLFGNLIKMELNFNTVDFKRQLIKTQHKILVL